MKKALLLINLQQDFLRGPMMIPEAENTLGYINELLQNTPYDEVIFSRDFYPENHISFADTHGKAVGSTLKTEVSDIFLYPKHCVADTQGASFPENLIISPATQEVFTGTKKDFPAYSSFFELNPFMPTGLHPYLQEKDIELIEIAGWGLEYRVKHTCLDAARLGYITCLHYKGAAAVNSKTGGKQEVILELLESSVSILS